MAQKLCPRVFQSLGIHKFLTCLFSSLVFSWGTQESSFNILFFHQSENFGFYHGTSRYLPVRGSSFYGTSKPGLLFFCCKLIYSKGQHLPRNINQIIQGTQVFLFLLKVREIWWEIFDPKYWKCSADNLKKFQFPVKRLTIFAFLQHPVLTRCSCLLYKLFNVLLTH